MSIRIRSRLVVGLALAAGVAGMGAAVGRAQQPARPQGDEAALVARARAIHERVITLDTHDDISPNNFRPDCNYTMRLTTQVNLPKMVEGGLDVSFMIVYVGQGPQTPEGYDSAYKQAIAKFDAVHRLTKEIAPKQIGLALTSADVRAIAQSGRKVAVIGIENAYPIGTDIKRVKEFWERGGRYMSLSHNNHSQLADSNTGEANNQWQHNGLSELGRQAVAEMNRWGIMVDVSHPAKTSNLQAIALSKAPVIASHSAARALANHSRNLDDEQLDAIKKNGGVVQTVAFASYVKVEDPKIGQARQQEIAAVQKEFGVAAAPPAEGARGGARGGGGGGRQAGGAAEPPPCNIENPNAAPAARGGGGGGGGRGGGGGGRGVNAEALAALSPERRADYDRQIAAVQAKYPPIPRANVADFVNHIDYLVKKMGIDHVGISSDFDGGGGVDGWNHAGETFNVTLELVRRGYTEAQIAKIWSGNLLRVWGEVEKVAKGIQAGTIR